MPFRELDLGLRVRLDPEAATEELLELLDKHNSSYVEVANHLGVSKTTVWRWMRKLEIEIVEEE